MAKKNGLNKLSSWHFVSPVTSPRSAPGRRTWPEIHNKPQVCVWWLSLRIPCVCSSLQQYSTERVSKFARCSPSQKQLRFRLSHMNRFSPTHTWSLSVIELWIRIEIHQRRKFSISERLQGWSYRTKAHFYLLLGLFYITFFFASKCDESVDEPDVSYNH